MQNSASQKITFKYLDLIMVVFVLVLVLSNIASSAKIIDWNISLFGKLPLIFDAGTLLFPISYIFGDILTEVYGFKRSRRIIWIGFGSLIFSALILLLVKVLPGEAGWQSMTGQQAYDNIFYGMTSGGLIAASLSGYLLGSFSNAIMMALLKTISKGKALWVRTISSTIVGEFMDTAVFILVATLFKVFSWDLFWSLVITNYIFKVGIEVLMTPATYFVVNRLKRAEGMEIFDQASGLNPLSFKDQ